MLWIVMLVGMVLCLVFAGIYYYILLKRFLSLFHVKMRKVVGIIIAALLGIFSANLFSTTGVVLVHIAVSALVVELLNLIIKKVGKKERRPKWEVVYKALVLPVLITAIFFVYGYFNIRNVVETKYEITTDKEIAQDIRVLLITDSHYGTIFETEGLNKLKARLDNVEADIVVLGGDLVDESTTKEQMQELFEKFGAIQSTYGVYYVYGNHDRQRYDRESNYTEEELRQAIEGSGIHILKDEKVSITEDVTLIGREDYSVRASGRQAIAQLMEGVDSTDFVIVADHQPVEYEENANAGTDLLLSGHTHAGQLFPVGIIMRIFKTSDQCYGIMQMDKMQAVVSSGVAGWGYPIRTQNHSEYTIIDVKRK